MHLPIEIILNIHRLSDIDTRCVIENAFHFNKLTYRIHIPNCLKLIKFRKVKDLYFNNAASIYYIGIPIKSTKFKTLIISKSCVYNHYYSTVNIN